MDISEETLEFAQERIQQALIVLVPRLPADEIKVLLNAELEKAQESYQDFLSMRDE